MNYTEYITQIEQQNGLILPQFYKRLAKDSMLDYAVSSRQEWQEKMPKLLENPPFLLICPDFEIPQADEMLGHLNEQLSCEPNDYFWLNPKYEHLIIPFAMNGAGDYFVFYYIDGKDKEPVIASINHDDYSYVLAKNLEDFMFYQLILTANAHNWFDEYDKDEYRQHILNQLQSHQPYLQKERFACLNEIYQRAFFQDTVGDWQLISDDEIEVLRQRFIDFDRYHQEFDAYIFECD